MGQEMIIGISIAAAVAVLIGIKTFLHSLVRFKMDESAVLSFFKQASGGYECHSIEVISAGTDIHPGRVSEVCMKSKAMKIHPKEKESWCLKQ